jgi:hypothetical protein
VDNYQFEEVRDEESGDLLWVGCRKRQSPWRFFVWVANTGRWHRYAELEPGQGWVDGVVFRKIDSSEVPSLIQVAGKIDETRFGWVLEEFLALSDGEILDNADLAFKGFSPSGNK